MKPAKIAITILFLLNLLVPSHSAHADIAPPSQPSGSNVVPGEVTMVQMVYERVVIDLRAPWSDGNDADITARFVMRNQGTSDEKMSVGFPLNSLGNIPDILGVVPKLKDLTIKVNDLIVDYQLTSEDKWLDNKDEKTHAVDWAIFDISFPVGKDVIIELNYKQPPTYDAPTTQYDYTLITGSGWYGPIGAGDIIFRLPYTISWGENYWTYDEENSWEGLSTETIVENEVRWDFEDFEPQNFIKDNWRVHVIRPKDWERVLRARQALIDNQSDAELWKELGDAYSNAAIELGGKTYDSSYDAILAYQQSVALKSDWAEAHACLAVEYYKAYSDSEFYASESHPPDESLRQGTLQELSVALTLDPTNKTALDLQELLEVLWPRMELPPPTPFATETLEPRTIMESIEVSPIVSVTPSAIVHTATVTPKEPTATTPPTEASVQEEPHNERGSSPIIFGALIIFIAGISVGMFLPKHMRK